MDRAELEGRLRTRHPSEPTYRRGLEPAAPRPFEREPEDDLAVDAADPNRRPPAYVDNFADADAAPDAEAEGEAAGAGFAADEPTRPIGPPVEQRQRAWPRYQRPEPDAGSQSSEQWPAADLAGEEREPAYRDEPVAAAVPPVYADELADDEYEEDAYGYGDAGAYYAEDRGRSNGGLLTILGLVALGAVALVAGILLSNVLGGNPGVGSASPTPTFQASTEPTATPPSEASAAASESSVPSEGPPGTFADGFTAQVEPCATTDMNRNGCAVSGSTITGNEVWVWIGFTKGNGSDVVGVTLVDTADSSSVGDASLELSKINCGTVCKGYIRFSFAGLDPGKYKLRVNRNGAPAAEAPFTVAG